MLNFQYQQVIKISLISYRPCILLK